jgi:hypothetical protein
MDDRAYTGHGGDSGSIRISRPVLYFGLIGSGVVWFGQLIVKYVIDSHSCYPGSMPASGAAPANLGWLWPALLAIDLVALAIALAAAFVSWRDWRTILAETGLKATEPTDAVETPARFFSLWGMAFAFCFSVAILFDLINVLVLHRCG